MSILTQTHINKLYCERMEKRNHENARLIRYLYNKELKDAIEELEGLTEETA